VRALVWPLEDLSVEEVESDLKQLEKQGMILRYETDNKKFAQVINWWKYQKMQWAGESIYPPPDGWFDRCRYHGPGRKIFTKNWNTPGGFVILVDEDVNVNVNVNDNDNDNDNALRQSTTTKVCDKGSQAITPYNILLDSFVNTSKLPLHGNLTQRDNESLVRMVEAGCLPSDIEAAVKYNHKNKLQIIGIASIEKGAMIERSKRLREIEQPAGEKAAKVYR